VMRKMGARSLAELVQLATTVGVLGRPTSLVTLEAAH
jgi:hypothetical protein